MARMPDIAREAADAIFRHRDQETIMTAPAPRNVIGEVAVNLGQLSGTLLAIGGNQLAVRLISEDLGRFLGNDDAEHVIALVRSLEAPHRQVEQYVPMRAPEQPVADGTTPRP